MTGEIRKEINSAIDKRPVERQSVAVCGGWTTGVPWIKKKKEKEREGKKKERKKEEWEGKRQSTCRFGERGL